MGDDREAPPPGMESPTSEQIEEALRQEIYLGLATLVGVLAPHFDSAEIPNLVEALVQEQLVVHNQILPAFFDPEIRRVRRELWVVITGPGGAEGHFKALKSVQEADGDPGLAVATAMVLTFLLNAGVRGILRIWGYDYKFVEPKPQDPPRIIV